jgi:hypothetical protein
VYEHDDASYATPCGNPFAQKLSNINQLIKKGLPAKREGLFFAFKFFLKQHKNKQHDNTTT